MLHKVCGVPALDPDGETHTCGLQHGHGEWHCCRLIGEWGGFCSYCWRHGSAEQIH